MNLHIVIVDHLQEIKKESKNSKKQEIRNINIKRTEKWLFST